MSEMTTHDYTNPRWGHDYIIHKINAEGMRISATGWGYGIREGDMLILPNNGGTTRYQVESIRYKSDPPDMWSAELSFAPRTDLD